MPAEENDHHNSNKYQDHDQQHPEVANDEIVIGREEEDDVDVQQQQHQGPVQGGIRAGGRGRRRRQGRRSRIPVSLWLSRLSPVLLAFGIILCVWVTHVVQSIVSYLFPDDHGGWARDPQEDLLLQGEVCDVVRIDVSIVSPDDFKRLYRGKRPVLLAGEMTKKVWPARKKWRKDFLIQQYGDQSIKAGTGSDVVNSGGGIGLASMPFKDFLLGLNDSSSDLFTFDTTAFHPENGLFNLTKDFETPVFFNQFDHVQARAHGEAWQMLSIGASRHGLPFHVHGETWFGLISGGYKRWFLYPPGQGLVNMNGSTCHPLLNVWQWFTKVRPTLFGDDEGGGQGRAGGRESQEPLEVTQRPGEILYLPAGWKHLTLNVGEVIGVGGQAAYDAKHRLRDSLTILKRAPLDYEALHGAGLSYAHKAMEEGLPEQSRQRYFNQSLFYFRTAAMARPCQPDAHLLAAEVLLATSLDSHYQRAKAIIHHAADLFDFNGLCRLPPWVKEEAARAALGQVTLKLARFFVGAGDGPEVEVMLGKVLEIIPTSAHAYADLAYVKATMGELVEAEEASRRAVSLAPGDVEMKERLEGVCLERYGERRGQVCRRWMEPVTYVQEGMHWRMEDVGLVRDDLDVSTGGQGGGWPAGRPTATAAGQCDSV